MILCWKLVHSTSLRYFVHCSSIGGGYCDINDYSVASYNSPELRMDTEDPLVNGWLPPISH
jgi:hypothetical protein